MNRSWNAKFICSALVATLVLATWASVQAAPLVTLSLEGRRPGEGAAGWRKIIENVVAGEAIEYRVMVDMMPVGTSNTQRDPASGQPVATAITSLTTGVDGMNSLYVALRQAASAPIQVNFSRGPIITDPDTGDMIDTQTELLVSSWRAGTGAFGGALEPRGGSTRNDLGKIRPVRASGNFLGIDPSPVLTPPNPNPNLVGRFTIGSINGTQGLVNVMWGGSTSGGGKINGNREIFVTDDTLANSTDPIVGFSPLTLNAIPEPSTVVLAGMGLIGLVVFARRRKA